MLTAAKAAAMAPAPLEIRILPVRASPEPPPAAGAVPSSLAFSPPFTLAVALVLLFAADLAFTSTPLVAVTVRSISATTVSVATVRPIEAPTATLLPSVWPVAVVVALLFDRWAPLGLIILATPIALIAAFHFFLTGNYVWGAIWPSWWAALAWHYCAVFARLWERPGRTG